MTLFGNASAHPVTPEQEAELFSQARLIAWLGVIINALNSLNTTAAYLSTPFPEGLAMILCPGISFVGGLLCLLLLRLGRREHGVAVFICSVALNGVAIGITITGSSLLALTMCFLSSCLALQQLSGLRLGLVNVFTTLSVLAISLATPHPDMGVMQSVYTIGHVALPTVVMMMNAVLLIQFRRRLLRQMDAVKAEHDHRAQAESAVIQFNALLERNNAQLAERERQLLRISRSPALEEGDLVAASRLVTSAAQSALGVRRASIWLFDEAAQGMALALLRDGDTENTGPLVLPYVAYPRYFAALRGSRVLLAHEARSDPATSEFAEGYLAPLDIHSMLDAGIHFGGRSVGVLCCEHTGAPRQWTEQEGFFAGALADALSRALAAAEKRKADEALRELNARLEDRVAERTATAEQAQQRLLNITDSISGLVYEYRRRADGSHSAPFVSSGVEQLLGLPPATVAGDVDRFFALVLPEDLPAYAEDIQRSADQGVEHRYLFRIRHAASGEVRWMLTSARATARQRWHRDLARLRHRHHRPEAARSRAAPHP